MKYSLLFLGCKVNQAEIAEFERAILGAGHSVVRLDQSPDVCIVNTCTVTSRSDHESRQLIRKASDTGAKVLVTGCYADQHMDETGSMPGVFKVFGNSEKDKIINQIRHDINNIPFRKSISPTRARYILKVQDGCDFSCTYCLVWKARGKSRSISIDEALDRIEQAASEGYKEIVLSGVHLGLYGDGISESLTTLIETALNKTNNLRFRLSSLEVNEITDHLLEIMTDPRMCPHLHIPLQSGDDGVLASMGRKYTAREFASRAEAAHKAIPNISIGSDVIAGFPSENDEAFENSYDFINSQPITYLHVFPYSIRPGTEAALFMDAVGDKTRRVRSARLRELGKAKKTVYIMSQIDRELELLIEESDSMEAWIGTTDNYLKARITSSDELRGRLVMVRVLGHDNEVLDVNPIPIL